MSQIFKGQTLLQLKLDTGIVITAATDMKILWRNPDNVSGEWPVVSIDGTKLVYNMDVADIDIAGRWLLQSCVTIGGKIGYGEIVRQEFTEILNYIAP